MNNDKYKAKLDKEVLYLLRLRAMEEGVVDAPTESKDLRDRETLLSYLGRQKENEQYFVKLSDIIGYEPDKEMKRVTVSKQSVWEKVKHILANVKGTISDSIRSVNIDGKDLDNETVMGLLARIFGFESGVELHDAVIIRDYVLHDSDITISVEDQDFIAQALGLDSWAEFNGRVNGKCKVSVTALKRMYGKTISTSERLRQKEDYIAFFIAETSWANLTNNLEQITEDLESHYFYKGSRSQTIQRRETKEFPRSIHSSRIRYGDKVTLTYYGGKQLMAEFQGDYTYKVLEVESEHLKVGYSFTAYEMHVDGYLHSNEVFDEYGDILDMMYDSSLIQKIHLEIVPSTPKKRTWPGLNE